MPPIFMIMGTPASGKSTVARALAARFSPGLHIPVDDLRQNVVGGLEDLSEDATLEQGAQVPASALAQILVSRRAASSVAQIYADASYAVAIDDFWAPQVHGFGQNPMIGYESLEQKVFRVVLLPSLAVTLERLNARGTDGEGMRRILEIVVRQVHPEIAGLPKSGWHVVDSSALSVEQTVDRVLELTRQGHFASAPEI